METLPETFPALPAHPDGENWSNNVTEAHQILDQAYMHAQQAFLAGDSDGHRLRIHSDRLLNRMLPILRALEPEVMNPDWVKTAAEVLAFLVVELEGSAIRIETVYVQ